jgi:TRAP-type uncharacterized transport system substrate-binding protein
MPPGLPNQPLAARLWMSRRSTRSGTDSAGRSISFESLESRMRSRVRMFLRHTFLVSILGTAAIGGCIWAGVYYSTKATIMRVAAGPAGSANEQIVQVLAKTVAQSHDRLALRLVPTDGPNASLQALAVGKADLAVLPTTVGKSPDWPVVAILRQNVMAFIVPAPPPPPPAPAATAAAPAAPPAAAPSPAPAAPAKKAEAAKRAPAKPAAKTAKPAKIAANDTKKKTKTKTAAKDTDADDDSDDSDDSTDTKTKDTDSNKLKVGQLAGKRVGIVTGNEATADLLNVVLKHYGVPADKVQVSQIDPQNLADAVHNNAIDVIFVADSAIGQTISDAVAAATQNGVSPTFIEIDQAEGIAKRLAAFDSVDIDAGTFGGNPPMPDDKLTTLSFPEYLVARKTFNHNAIAELAKQIYTSRLTIAAQMGGEVKIEAPSTDKDADALVHQGALDYLNDDQKTFFDRYGDDIFYGMLIFPVFGSAIAGVASYLRADSRTRRLRLLQRVLDLVRKAHAAQTLEAIEHLQVEADHLVIAIIHLSEHEEFDETIRMSFAFALDQLRFAIAGRRTAILDHAGAPPSEGSAAEQSGSAAAA